MAAQYYKINYKSDFVLTINSDAGWAVPFCIKFWTGMPSQAYFAGFDGENYVNCRVGETPTQLLVMFDDHHMPIGPLRMQIAYHTTIEEFPDKKFDEVTNPTNVTVDIDGTEYQVMLDFTGETGADIDFSMPSSGVMSVNGKIGYVTLNAEDVGAQPTIEDLATIRSGAAAGATAYQKPAGGIPKTDLASAVQTSLNKADAAAPQSDTYTKSQVNKLIEGASSLQTMIVTISPDGNEGYEADKTFAEIKAFLEQGGTVIAKDEEDGNSYYYLDNYIASEVVFCRNIWGNSVFTTRSYTIDNTDTVSFDDALHHISSSTNSSSTTDLANSAAVKAVKDEVDTKQDTISDLSTIRSGAAAGATAVQPAALTPIENALQTIEAVIPSAASSQNQLADKNFVNSSISTNTANFVGTYNSLAELQAVQNPTNNDYGFVIETDAQGNEYYDRYKYVANSQQWLFEYKVESTPFTAAQWAAIQSGITSALVTKLNALPTNAELQHTLAAKQDTLTFDDTPTANSNNPVKSSGIKTAIDAKVNSSDVYTKSEVDELNEDAVYFGDTMGNVVTADFNAQTDTVWHKAQVLSSAQKQQARDNIGAAGINDVAGMQVISHGTSDTTFALTPNKFHVWGEVASLTLTFATGEVGYIQEYLFQFTSGSTATTINLPSSVKWITDNTVEANKTYQVSILNSLAVMGGA